MKPKSKIKHEQLAEAIKAGDIALFLGNGFSIDFNKSFEYEGLIEKIQETWYPDNLINEILKVKYKSNIKTFEDLWLDLQKVFNRDLMSRLAHPIIDIHKKLLTSNIDGKLKQYGKWIAQFPIIFTTNYDLLLHWMLQATNTLGKKYKDGISNNSGQNVYYLHGALHLYYLYSKSSKNGWDVSYRRISGNNKEEMIGKILKEKIKLEKNGFFEVFGGTYQEKDYYINRVEYLHACRETLESCSKSNLLIFGSSFGENDRHLWSIISRNDNIQNLYISTLTLGKKEEFKKFQEIVENLFPNKKIYYFNPIGVIK